MEEKKKNYSASNLTVLKGLEPVRERPGMYIGTTDTQGLHHLIWEIVDNAVDEANEGYGKEINITINQDNSITVEDQGRGVPCDYNEKEKMSGFDIVYKTLHGGGKFDESNYKSAGGLHGVGGAVVNALSTYMEIHSYRDGFDNFIKYADGGKKASKQEKVALPDGIHKRGTTVTFLPDKTIFDDVSWDFNRIAQHLDDSACLTQGVTFNLRDINSNRKVTFCYKKGLEEFFEKSLGTKQTNCSIVKIKGVSDDRIDVEVVYTFIKDNYDEKILSFANGVKTGDGGHHVAGFKKALTNAYNDYATKRGLLKNGNKLEGDDIREGLSAIISVRVPESLIQFEGQTKSKLGTKQALQAVDSIVENYLSHYLEEHAKESDVVIKKSIEAMNLKKKTKELKDSERGKGKNGPATAQLSGKLNPCSSKDYLNNELFIVEGDSAGGTAKSGRNPKYQAILPLRGKPKNVTDTNNVNDILENKELSTLIYTIGTGSDKDFNIKNLHYGKIIIMTDADDDGAHIQNLLLGFFYKHMKPLVEGGYIYIANAPLYRVYNNKQSVYCWSEEERQKAIASISNYKIKRYKGLGEMGAKELAETTMQRGFRKLKRLVLNDDDECSDKVNLFLGKDSDRRKDWINNQIDFTVTDFDFKVANKNGK